MHGIKPLSEPDLLGVPQKHSGDFRRSGTPAWLLSVFLHASLVTGLVIVSQTIRRGAEAIENRTGGIVLVAMRSETTEYLTEGDIDQVTEQTSGGDLPPALPTTEAPAELPGIASQNNPESGTGNEILAGTPGADDFSQATQDRTGKVGGEVTTEFFGIPGTGNEFVYLFDRSGSMEGYDGRPLRAAKRQLIESISSLGPNQRFQLVFYNHETRTFNPNSSRGQLLFAEEPIKIQATRFIESIRGDGGTDHLAGIKLALQFAPDVLFILSDAEGGFTAAEMTRIASWNRKNTVIHVIEFGDGPQSPYSDRSFERLAREHRGQYLYKNVATFQD